MAYLLTQILFCLALAMIAGLAIGWLLNGYRAARREQKIKGELMRQSLALNQAETDNRMIEEDYRELKMQSEETISLYRDENKQIPVLKQNLEKSQTLVRQQIQKHDIEIRNLQQETEKYQLKSRELENREKAVKRLQMDLNTARIQHQSTDPANLPATDTTLLDDHGTDAEIESLLARKEAELQQAELQLDAIQEQRNTQVNSSAGTVISESPYEDLSLAVDNVLARNAGAGKLDLTELSQLASEADAALSTEQVSLWEPASLPTQSSIDQSSTNQSAGTGSSTHMASESTASTEEPDPAVTENTPAQEKQHTSPNSEKSTDNGNVELPEFGSFGASERNDELQQIFGIGPVTEKTLRSLGITSFEQIATFEQEQIEQVAAALEIFPGRIMRDNWVESAKKLIAEESAGKKEIADQLHDLEDA